MANNITYTERANIAAKPKDGFSDVLTEASDFFSSKGIQMTNPQGFNEIISDQSYFNSYKNYLTEGMEYEDAENFSQLMDNSRLEVLQEATVSGIDQLAGLSMPTIRKMWAKIALKHAIPTQAVKTPRFAISYMKSYLIDRDGNKKPLPESINDMDDAAKELDLPMTTINNKLIPIPSTDYDVMDDIIKENELNVKYKAEWSRPGWHTLDKVFYIEYIEATGIKCTDDEGHEVNGIDLIGDKALRVHLKTDLQGTIFGEINIPVMVDDPVNTGEYITKGHVKGRIFARVDYENGTLTIADFMLTPGKDAAATATVANCKINARVTQEWNDYGDSVSFDILTKDVTIGTGTHLNAPLPIEWLQDTMAIYNIDGAAEVIDIMSQTMAQKLELEIYKFLWDSVDKNDVNYIGEFNMHPSAGFAGSPKEWREELKTVIDYMAISMKTDSKFSSGKFVIIGNPIDMQLIPNVNWVFTHTNEDMNGVEVGFNLGAYSGTNNYELVSSDLVRKDYLLMFFVPATDRLMTYKYYPYTFNVERGYRDPNAPNVPSIMMTKRHALEEFTPLISRIHIIGNRGTVPATNGY